MIRAAIYLLVAGGLWMAEGFLFSRLLGFAPWQVAIMVIMYAGLFVAALALLVRFARRYHQTEAELPIWRLISLAPMLLVVVGSFISLPLLLLIAGLGKLG